MDTRELSYRDLSAKGVELLQKLSHKQAAIQQTETNLAALKAKIEYLDPSRLEPDAFGQGSRWVLSSRDKLPLSPSTVRGALADKISAEKPFQLALEATLRAWSDALVVEGQDNGVELLRLLEGNSKGPAKLFLAHVSKAWPLPLPSDLPGTPLFDYVSCSEELSPFFEQLLRFTRVVSALDEIPIPVPPPVTYVTKTGCLLRYDGFAEYYVRGEGPSNPVVRKHRHDELSCEADGVQEAIKQLDEELKGLLKEKRAADESCARALERLDESKRALAVTEGEHKIIRREAEQAQQRAQTVSDELELMSSQDDTALKRQSEIKQTIEETRNQLAETRISTTQVEIEYNERDAQRIEDLDKVSEQRVQRAECVQRVEAFARRREELDVRMAEVEERISDRTRDADTYRTRIQDIEQTIERAQSRLAPLQTESKTLEESLAASRKEREEKTKRLTMLTDSLRTHHSTLEELQRKKSEFEIARVEKEMGIQNLLERIDAEFQLSIDDVMSHPPPHWEENQAPDEEGLASLVSELKAKLDAMGQVNLVAIEEHKELEERYTFLTQQQEDLTASKKQLLDTIRRIDQKTTEMFSSTFETVNQHFQKMFKKLFGGGSAKLVLMDEGEILESGIEIIARPPGKKLQSVSLLSGGERTMTAVALLFSLYEVKSSPFCVLDELDAALDEANIGRFVSVLQDFLKRSQFVVITHNRQTIAAADVLYGVTMEEGVSRIVSAKFSEKRKEQASLPLAETSEVLST